MVQIYPSTGNALVFAFWAGVFAVLSPEMPEGSKSLNTRVYDPMCKAEFPKLKAGIIVMWQLTVNMDPGFGKGR